jgi:hypothetical protein
MINEDRTEDKSGTPITERKTITQRAQRSEEVTKVVEGSCLPKLEIVLVIEKTAASLLR